MSRVFVLAETPTSELSDEFTPVVTLPMVSILNEPGTNTFLRLLSLNMESLIGTTDL